LAPHGAPTGAGARHAGGAGVGSGIRLADDGRAWRVTLGAMNVEPVTLEGRFVRLEPLTIDHVPALCRVGLEPQLWRWVPTAVTTVDEMRTYVVTALDEMRRAVSVPFVIVDRASDQVIGSTRYANIDTANRRLEIGWTWVTSSHQRTRANTEAKLLLLTHAFETLDMNRVEFKTDALNEQSRKAIARLGAVEEGTFRRHMVIAASGRIRDSVYFSIIDAEWPAIKTRLAGLLAR
jgi:N-acetyltransferase